MIEFKQKGDFSSLTSFLRRNKKPIDISILKHYGEKGVEALRESTPMDTGKTADSWTYEIKEERGSVVISFLNSNIQNGFNIAVILQYGHGTGTGGWVEGRDYINPSIQPIFDEIAEQAWKEVNR